MWGHTELENMMLLIWEKRPIVSTMVNNTKRRIMLKDSGCTVNDNALWVKIIPFHNKMLIVKLIEKWKNKVKDVSKEGKICKYGHNVQYNAYYK